MHEIRLVGRGGQGVVTAGELLGRAAVQAGWSAQSIPTFGPERRGALSQATLRLQKEVIRLKCTTSTPDVLLVLDPTIWRQANIAVGLREHSQLIFNVAESAERVREDLLSGRYGYALPVSHFTVYQVDATAIALETLGRPITNTAMMGALVGATGLIDFDAVEEALTDRFGARAADNIAAARAARDGLKRAGD